MDGNFELAEPLEERDTHVSAEFGAALLVPGGRLKDSTGKVKLLPPMWWQYNDGGRNRAGFIGDVGDCVTRAIAIAAEKPYREVYDTIANLAVRDEGIKQAHLGVSTEVIREYLSGIDWKWIAVKKGEKVYLNPDELPEGRVIVHIPGHLVAVIGGVLHDIFTCNLGGTQLIDGYYTQKV